MPKIMFLLPFATKTALAVSLARGLTSKHVEIALFICAASHPSYELDSLEDFLLQDRLFFLRDEDRETVDNSLFVAIERFKADVLIQIGASQLYRALPRIRERCPDIVILDFLYNQFGHAVNHFLFERVFDGVIVESIFMRDFVLGQSLNHNLQVYIVNSGINLPTTDEIEKKQKHIDEKKLVVGYIGRLSAEKGPLEFIDMCEKISGLLKNNNVVFQIYGQGPMHEVVVNRCLASSISMISFMGYAENVETTLKSFDALVVPSIFDGRPVIIMEAGICGTPVFASPVGGIPEMVVDGVNGFLLNKNPAELIANQLSAWQSNPSLLIEMKTSCQEFARQHFDVGKMHDRFVNVINQAVRKKRHGM